MCDEEDVSSYFFDDDFVRENLNFLMEDDFFDIIEQGTSLHYRSYEEENSIYNNAKINGNLRISWSSSSSGSISSVKEQVSKFVNVCLRCERSNRSPSSSTKTSRFSLSDADFGESSLQYDDNSFLLDFPSGLTSTPRKKADLNTLMVGGLQEVIRGAKIMLTWSTILVLTVFHTIALGQKNIDDWITDVFGKQPTTISNQDTSTVSTVIDLQPHFRNTSTTNNNDNCTCVYFYLCNNGTIIIDGKGIIDIRSNINQCGNNLEVCCNLKDINENRKPPQPTVKSPGGCGYRNREGLNFKITGDADNEAQFGEFPWMVAILRENTNVYQCGGALIHPQVVLTAAHCVSDRSKKFKIRAGEWDSQHKAEPYPHQDRKVQSVTKHPKFNSGALYNDVALLVLDSPVEIAEHIGIVCLPSQEDMVRSGRCFATGWGKDVFGKKGKYQVILKSIDLPIVPNPQCQANLRDTRLGKYFELHASFICAGGEPDKDTCKGDGGSPLVCPISGSTDRYFQAGIVAWGIGCGGYQIPGVYANVAKFRDWIDEQMDLLGFDKSSYQY